MKNTEIKVDIIACINLFTHCEYVQIVKIHMGCSPKQFEDASGNLWFANEISNLHHFDAVL